MKRRAWFSAAAVVWLSTAAGVRASAGTEADDPGFEVVSYDVELTPDFKNASVSGVERIRVHSIADGVKSVSFSANALRVVASIDGEAMVASEVVGDRLVFHLPKVLAKGQTAQLIISFSGSAPKGLVFIGDTVRATYFTCDYMICDSDRPGDKATLEFSLRLAKGMDAVAPGRLARVSSEDGVEPWRWRERRPTSAYLFGFAAGRFERVVLAGTRPKLFVLTNADRRSQAPQLFADTRRMLNFFEEKSGVRFREPAYTQVLVEDSEAQEAAAHSTIGTEEITPILTDPHEDWAVAHELAHQWWGNSLTCADWSELWLNEGLTVFMVAAYKEQRWGRADYDRELALANKRWAAAKALDFDVPLSWKGTYPSLKLKRAMAYAKSVVFLDTLRNELGEIVFWRAIKDYTRGHVGDVVTARDLQHAMERAAGKDLSALFDAWVFGVPSN